MNTPVVTVLSIRHTTETYGAGDGIVSTESFELVEGEAVDPMARVLREVRLSTCCNTVQERNAAYRRLVEKAYEYLKEDEG